MLRTLTCVTLGMTAMNSFTNEISHLLKKRLGNVHLHKSNSPPLLSSNKMFMLFISHTRMCTQMLYFEPKESNKSSASLLDTEYMGGSCNENFKTERGPQPCLSSLFAYFGKTENKKQKQQLIKMFSSMILIHALYMSVRNYLFHIHMAPACISNGTSWFWTWRLITCLSLPTSCWPMNTAGKLCRNPSCTSALSICCPFVILSSS